MSAVPISMNEAPERKLSSHVAGLGFRSPRNIVEGVLSRAKRGKSRTFRLHRAGPATVRCETEA